MKSKAVWAALIVFLLAGCGRIGATPQALPTVVLDSGSAAPAAQEKATEAAPGAFDSKEVTASGFIAPARQVMIASPQGGIVEAVQISEGEQVRVGQVLVRMAGSEQLLAAVEGARTELLAAQQEAEHLRENAGPARAAALLRLANANKALDEAQKTRGYRQYRNGSDAMINTAQADIILARDVLDRAQEAYNGVSGLDDSNVTKAGALSALSAAQKAYDRAVANLNYLLAMPSQIEVDLAEAKLQAAQAEVEAAQWEYDKLQEGPDPQALALTEQRIKNAQAQLAASEAALRNVEITAPIDATVAQLNTDPGAWVTPGQPLILLADLAHLQVRTTDLSERDAPFVQVGQPALVYVKALNVEAVGRVEEISPLAEALGGDVVYPITLVLDAAPAGLRAGMSAEVRFLSEP